MRLHKDNLVGRRPWFRVAELERETRRSMKKKYDRKEQLVDRMAKVMNLIYDGSVYLVRSFGDCYYNGGLGGVLEVAGSALGFTGTVSIYHSVDGLEAAQEAIERAKAQGLELLATATKTNHVMMNVAVFAAWEKTEEATAQAFISQASRLYERMLKCIVP